MTARVLVVYEASVSGRVALAHAESVARAAQASLTVLAVIPHEPENVGCTRCRHNARCGTESSERSRTRSWPKRRRWPSARQPVPSIASHAATGRRRSPKPPRAQQPI